MVFLSKNSFTYILKTLEREREYMILNIPLISASSPLEHKNEAIRFQNLSNTSILSISDESKIAF